MQNLIRGGGATGGGGEFSQAPWTQCEYFERPVTGNFTQIIPPPGQPIKIYLLNKGSNPVILSLGVENGNSPWLLLPGYLFEEEIFQPLYAKADGGETSLNLLIRSREAPSPGPNPISPTLFIPVPHSQIACSAGSFLWSITAPTEPVQISVDFSLMPDWWYSEVIQIGGYSSDNFSSLFGEERLWASDPYGPAEGGGLTILPTESATYVALNYQDMLGGGGGPMCSEWIQAEKTFRILAKTSFI